MVNYRPVSLLSIVSKNAEICVYNEIYSSICTKLSHVQHGFMKDRSTATQLLQFVENINNVLDRNSETGVKYIHLRLTEAFDSVLHNMLLYKTNKIWYSW